MQSLGHKCYRVKTASLCIHFVLSLYHLDSKQQKGATFAKARLTRSLISNVVPRTLTLNHTLIG